MQYKTLTNIKSIARDNDALLITTPEATVRIWVYSDTVVRVNVSTAFENEDSFAVIRKPLDQLQYTESDENILITTPMLKLRIGKSPLRFSFLTVNDEELSRDDDRFGVAWHGDRVINYRKLYPDEKFIGLGEKTGPINKRGRSYVNWNTDAALHDTRSDPLYKTFPFYIGIHDGLTYGLFLDNTHKTYFDLGASTDEEMIWLGADSGDLNYYFFGSQGVGKIIEDYTWLTGRMEMPPLWSLGYQQCRWSYMSAAEVLDIAERFRKENIPADVMYCDIDYMDAFKIFTWNPDTFPDPKGLLDKLKELNFRLVAIVDPGIKIEEGYKEYDEGIANGYFATYPNGQNYVGEVWPGRCHFPNFFSPEVRQWWGAAFTALTEAGVEGFWNDMNEPATWGQNMPWLVKFGDKFMPEVRNVYGMEMARATYDGVRKILGNKRPFVLTRAAYAGTQRYSAIWTGDNSAYDEHMLLGQRLVSGLGITGMSLVGVDIGGFTGDPTPELMVRWNSLGVYTPMFRNHAMEGTIMREPWQWGPENMSIIKKDIEKRYRLLPYIYSAFYQSHQTGMPISRMLPIDYTFDENVYFEAFENEFLFGDSILLAPVESTRTEAEVYLPAGNWHRLSTGERYGGEAIYTVPAPLTDLPVFIKAGAIIPMQNVVQSTNEQGDGVLELHIWHGTAESSFLYYEDDGLSYDYENERYYKREVRFDPDKKSITLGQVEGSFISRFNKIKLAPHGFPQQASFGVNGSVPDSTIEFIFENDNEEIEVSFEY